MRRQSEEKVKQQILIYIHQHCIGRKNATPKRQIMYDLGLTDERAFRICIHELRIETNPILSACENPAGYFIPIDPSEIEDAMYHFRNRIINQNRAVLGIKLGLRERFKSKQKQLNLISYERTDLIEHK